MQSAVVRASATGGDMAGMVAPSASSRGSAWGLGVLIASSRSAENTELSPGKTCQNSAVAAASRT